MFDSATTRSVGRGLYMHGHQGACPTYAQKRWFQGELLTSSPTQFEPFSDALNWVKANNAVCPPMPIHRLCTQTFSPPQKANALLGIKPAAPPPSQSPSRDVNPLHQSTTPALCLSTSGQSKAVKISFQGLQKCTS